jgi:hypothetical protein
MVTEIKDSMHRLNYNMEGTEEKNSDWKNRALHLTKQRKIDWEKMNRTPRTYGTVSPFLTFMSSESQEEMSKRKG